MSLSRGHSRRARKSESIDISNGAGTGKNSRELSSLPLSSSRLIAASLAGNVTGRAWRRAIEDYHFERGGKKGSRHKAISTELSPESDSRTTRNLYPSPPYWPYYGAPESLLRLSLSDRAKQYRIAYVEPGRELPLAMVILIGVDRVSLLRSSAAARESRAEPTVGDGRAASSSSASSSPSLSQ